MKVINNYKFMGTLIEKRERNEEENIKCLKVWKLNIFLGGSRHNETSVKVFETIANVDASMVLAVNLMVCCVTLPHIVSNEGEPWVDFLERPAALWKVARDTVQEITLKDGIVSFQLIFLKFLLNISKMRVVPKIKCLSWWQSLESFITLNFMRWCKLH